MSEPAIETRGLTKEYRLGEHLSLHKTFTTLLRRPLDARRNPYMRALDDVSFSVGWGESLGIVGTNGSGKSTLLQLISGITAPSGGEVRVYGGVLPLLEIGAGFHSELTGRENVNLQGIILGLSRAQTAACMDAIAEFAELESHMETPLKRFSAGMRARLSFAVAMNFDADIYVFDEVLAVVDDGFAARCLYEIERLYEEEGKTVLFVSHDLDQVRAACSRILWLEGGKVRGHGAPDEVLEEYTRHTGVLA